MNNEQKEILESIDVIAKEYYNSTARVYNGLVIEAVSPHVYNVKVNGHIYSLRKYGLSIPAINSHVPVFVPFNNWSQAFFIVTDSTTVVETADYNALTNQPSINGITLLGNKTSSNLNVYGVNNPPPYPVLSVNNKTEQVELLTDDIPATVTNRYVPAVPSTNSSVSFLNGDGVFVPIAVGGATSVGNIFPSNVNSSVEGYKTLSYGADNTVTEISVSMTSSQDILSATFLYTAPLGVTSIDAGIWKSAFYMKSSANAGNNRLKVVCFVRHENGTETDLFTAYTNSVSQTSFAYFYTETNRSSYTVSPTDTLGFRIYGTTNREALTTVTYQIGGNNASYLNSPLVLRHSQLRDLNGDTNFMHMGLSTHTFSTNDTTATYTVAGYITNVSIIDTVTKHPFTLATLTYNNITGLNNSLTISMETAPTNNLMVIITYVIK